ncbi:MAG: oxygen-independent coproporphyrinogen oxidase [Ramlibacter sp.]|nr:oxygen-independent coproporphyrinogen oxidase [Ramlibacter sp.]
METVSLDLLRRYGGAGPRYTSYPTTDRFVEAFTDADQARALAQRRGGCAIPGLPLSVSVHIPLRESLCDFCSCNKIGTRQHGRAGSYLRYLTREVELQVAHLGAGHQVTQLHLGGGAPTFLSDGELRELMAILRGSFTLVPGGDCSIEIDPRSVDASRLGLLYELGFNRISFGVQDFDPAVQRSVHRVHPFAQVKTQVAHARELGFGSVNVDLIYGLPRQTPDSFSRTLAQVELLRPDRVAVYAYAHLPERFRARRRIVPAELPAAAAREAMLSRSLAVFGAAGYAYIGMEQFALPGDSLAVAQRLGRLHRNFHGYSTQPDGDVIGLGVSALGRVGASYAQNAKTLQEYCDLLDAGRLPVVRGLALTRDDLVRRAVIMALMCQGEVVYESIQGAWLLDFPCYFARELEQMAGLAAQGLVVLGPAWIQVTAQGRFLLREVATVFDRYLQADRNRAKFSRIL